MKVEIKRLRLEPNRQLVFFPALLTLSAPCAGNLLSGHGLLEGIGIWDKVSFAVGLALLGCGIYLQTKSRDARWAFNLVFISGFSAYAVLEAGFSTHRAMSGRNYCILLEDTARANHFDPIRGYFLSSTPVRFLRIDHGKVEYQSTVLGNNWGFPDPHDFSPKRKSAAISRWAVFGDSFTAGQYLKRNWPAAVQAQADDLGVPIELLNFSVDGGGLANWWNVLKKIIEKEGFELDGILFAVFQGDLDRRFSMADYTSGPNARFGRVDHWDPDRFPTRMEEAERYLSGIDIEIVPGKVFDASLQSGFCPPSPTASSEGLFVFSRLRAAMNKIYRPGAVAMAPPPGTGPFNQGQLNLIRDIREYVESRSLKTFVVALETRDSLINGTSDGVAQARAFANELGGTFVEAKAAFPSLDKEEILRHFLTVDGHWNQLGSDRFADYFVQSHLTSLLK